MTNFQDFLHKTSYDDLPQEVIDFARRCLLDLVGILISGKTTELSKLICDHASEQFGAGSKSASLLLDGRNVSPAGAALANGMTIDSIDAHDGYKPTKGHIGCHVLPTLIAMCEAEQRMDGREFIRNLVLGYEIGGRAGIALHASVPDYHTSGAWGAVTSAALGAQILKLDKACNRLGIWHFIKICTNLRNIRINGFNAHIQSPSRISLIGCFNRMIMRSIPQMSLLNRNSDALLKIAKHSNY